MINKRYFVLFFCALFLFPLCGRAEGIEYTVQIAGVEEAQALKALRAASDLVQLKKRPPGSLSALHYRAESDVGDLKQVLASFGYFEAVIQPFYEERQGKVHVTLQITLGPLYTLGSYTIHLTTDGKANPLLLKRLNLSLLGLELKRRVLTKELISAELKLLERLAHFSYPLAKIVKKEVVADGDTKQVDVVLDVDTGPFCHFGELTIQGLSSTRSKLICKKLEWCCEDPYKSSLVQKTQDALIKTGLFTSALITHADELNSCGFLPMKVEVTESKHHSVNLGVSYQTFFGPGLTFGWENRNIGGMGRRLSIQGDATKRSHSGLATLFLPDFYTKGQNYIWQAQAMHESITAYSQISYTLLTRLERQFGRRFSSSIALELEKLNVNGSVKNGRFLLFEIPLYTRWSSANSLLNPTKGATLDLLIVPTVDTGNSRTCYLEQEVRLSHYLPLTESHSISFAQKITLGSILSPRFGSVPVPKRFFGGSEEDLRGYKYKTVSPLSKSGKPMGGRSIAEYTFETRLRLCKSIGLVPFFDVGNVYKNQFPTFDGKWRKSLGLGLRYFSYIGPIRFDVGFPLNRRRGIDPKYRLLVSIGQAF